VFLRHFERKKADNTQRKGREEEREKAKRIGKKTSDAGRSYQEQREE
jgi:hypothetical protein